MREDGRSSPGAPIGSRFMRKTELSESGCWLWGGYIDGKGYGIFGIRPSEPVKAHRFSYEHFVGPIPDGLQVDHLCRTRHCVNPEHLEPVTNRENAIRGIEARPIAAACKKGHKFTEENTYTNPRGHRECRICRASASSEHRRKLCLAE